MTLETRLSQCRELGEKLREVLAKEHAALVVLDMAAFQFYQEQKEVTFHILGDHFASLRKELAESGFKSVSDAARAKPQSELEQLHRKWLSEWEHLVSLMKKNQALIQAFLRNIAACFNRIAALTSPARTYQRDGRSAKQRPGQMVTVAF